MENALNCFSFNYKSILTDEIALEGLEGIGIDLLWRRVQKRISSPISDKMKSRFWDFVVKNTDISMYKLQEPLEYVEIIDRFSLIDEETGQLADPPVFLDGPYEYHPVDNEYGSCAVYNTRTLISKEELQGISYEKVVKEYGDTLVMVASIEERWRALAPQLSISNLSDMTPTRYCILELIGKSRENGQMTIGKTNITKITNDSKLLFYNRNYLQQLDLVRFHSLTQIIGGKGVKAIMLRLKRFHTPYISCMPKVGKIRTIIDHLLNQPDYSDRTDNVINQGMLTQKHYKKLNKTANIFNFEDRTVALVSSKKSKKPFVKKRFICLTSPSDESSESEGENTAEPLKCRYKIGVTLLRQAYELFVEAGLKGHTQIELAQLLGIEFYTARTLCRIFRSRNIVREFLEDKGKQRTARFIAVQATKELDVKYAEEKKKLMDFLESAKIKNDEVSQSIDEVDSEYEVPKKKVKLEKNEKEVNNIIGAEDLKTLEEQVTEVKVLDGLENSKSKSLLNSTKPTLRQLRFANGILKVMSEKLVISGYQTLSTLVSKEINDAPMDTKSLKIFVQKLVTDGQVKVLKMKWPGHHLKYSILLCAPFVKPTDPIIKSKYKEISMRAIRNRKTRTKKILVDSSNHKPLALSLFNYPRYMKIQKLHEFIMKMMYFNDGDYEASDLPEGFTSLIHILPEFTVEFTLANISQLSIRELSTVNITNDILDLKLKNAPTEIFRIILMSSSLQNSIRTNLKVLAMLGLIQLIKEPNQNDDNIMLSYVFYVNRHAKIIDTTGMWPRRNVDKKKLEKSYYFETFNDVETYWQDVRTISTRTTIELDRDSRNRKRLTPVVRLKKDVTINDNGQVLGNGLGPCGFDSCFYMELPRFWSTFYSKVKRKQLHLKNPIVKLPKKDKPKPVKKVAKKKVVPTFDDKFVIRVRRRKREVAENLPKWTREEDKIIMLCKAAITIMSPVSQPGCLRLRNVVARDLITLWDPKKLANHCHKRALSTESNSTLVFEKESLVSELRHRPNILHKYDGLLKKLRIRYAGNMSRLILEAKIPMFELVWIMSQLTRSKSYKQRVPCIALNLEDFNAKFTISASSANRSCNLYRTLDNEAKLAAIKEAIIVTVMSSFKTEQTQEIAEKIYEMFNDYSEPILRNAIEHLRKCGAVAAKEKLLNNQIHRFNFQDIIQASYKVSAAYQRKWICRLNSEFVDNLTSCLDDDMPQNGLKGSPELNCMLSELHSCGVLDIISVTVPVISGSSGSIIQEEQLSVCDILMKFKLKSGTCGWKNKTNLKKLSDLYQGIEYKEIIDQILRNYFITTYKTELETNHKITSHLRDKKEEGSTFRELQEITGDDTKVLKKNLQELESENKIKLIGYYENRIVLTEFTKPWTVNLDKQDITPAPWLTINKQIRYDVFLKWAGVVVNRVFKYPGCSIAYIADASEFLTTRSAQDLCVFLEKCGCVKLQVLSNAEPDLFSEDVALELEDFNPYESTENILVFPVKNSLTRYAYLRKTMLEEYFKQA